MESRFILVYGASHALASAALRWHGFRSENRYLVVEERLVEEAIDVQVLLDRVSALVPRGGMRSTTSS